MVVIDIYSDVNQFIAFKSASNGRPRVRDLHKIDVERNSEELNAKRFFNSALMSPVSDYHSLYKPKVPVYKDLKRSNLGLLSSFFIYRCDCQSYIYEEDSILPYVLVGQLNQHIQTEKTPLINILFKALPASVLNIFKH